MLPRAEITGTRPVVYVEAPTPVSGATDARQEAFSRLSRLSLGQMLQAEVLSKLDDGTFLVKVADTTARMSLPAGTQVGDELPLTLVAKDPRPTFLLGAETNTTPTTLSSAGKMINTLLQNAQQGGAATALVGKAPLVASPGAATEQVTAALHDTLAFSGLFYESHLGEWAEGNRSLQDLMREPQATTSTPLPSPGETAHPDLPHLLNFVQAGITSGRSLPEMLHELQAKAAGASAPQQETPHSEFSPLLTLVKEWTGSGRALPDLIHELQTKADANTMSHPGAAKTEPAKLLNLVREWTDSGRSLQDLIRASQAQNSPDSSAGKLLDMVKEWTTSGRSLQDLIRESQAGTPALQTSQKPEAAAIDTTQIINLQLNALEQQRVVWQGELWPGQQMEWEVSRDAPESSAEYGEESQQPWQSVVRFELPTLGAVAATIHLIGDRVSVQIRTASESTAVSLRTHGRELADALGAAGSPLDLFTVTQDEQA
jgi:hypothetical protein